jgi:hypothetical protein
MLFGPRRLRLSLNNSYVLFGGDVILYLEDGAIMLKTCDPHGDAVELKNEEAVTLSHLLRELAQDRKTEPK